MVLCEACPKRATCVELCPEAEAYVSQDHKGQNTDRELVGITIDPSRSAWTEIEGMPELPLSAPDLQYLSEHQADVISRYYLLGETVVEIGAALNITHQTVSEIIQRGRQALRRVVRRKQQIRKAAAMIHNDPGVSIL
ncbi:MAG: sigma-70 family RNA polymerase sigma factor [Candidatus Tectomicrobia bacterium]|nr:sigma-70 family RNA polymerase sigma factor [Candidatus Tectomicrobia bacterium]